MCFINLLKKSAVSDLGFKRAARSVHGNTAYLTPLATHIPSTSFCHVHLHRAPAAAEGPPWLGQGSHLQVTVQRRLQQVIHHWCHQPAGRSAPADPAPVWAPRRGLEAASTAAPMQLKGFSFSSCSYGGLPLLLSFFFPLRGLLFYTSAESCAFQKPSMRPGEIHNISANFRWNDGDQFSQFVVEIPVYPGKFNFCKDLVWRNELIWWYQLRNYPSTSAQVGAPPLFSNAKEIW